MARYEVTTKDDLQPGAMKSISCGQTQVLVANVDGAYYAVNDLCPHLAVPMSQGTIREQCVVCPGHGSEFELATGRVVKWVGREPGFLGRLLSGKSQQVTTYPVIIDGEKIYVDV